MSLIQHVIARHGFSTSNFCSRKDILILLIGCWTVEKLRFVHTQNDAASNFLLENRIVVPHDRLRGDRATKNVIKLTGPSDQVTSCTLEIDQSCVLALFHCYWQSENLIFIFITADWNNLSPINRLGPIPVVESWHGSCTACCAVAQFFIALRFTFWSVQYVVFSRNGRLISSLFLYGLRRYHWPIKRFSKFGHFFVVNELFVWTIVGGLWWQVKRRILYRKEFFPDRHWSVEQTRTQF